MLDATHRTRVDEPMPNHLILTVEGFFATRLYDSAGDVCWANIDWVMGMGRTVWYEKYSKKETTTTASRN